MKQVRGKVAVVTGGAGGIGRALVERFTDEGMKVVLADVVPDAVEQTAAALRAEGREVLGVVTDVTSLESVEALRDATLAEYGAVHVVCNNAGIGSGSEGHVWEHHVKPLLEEYFAGQAARLAGYDTDSLLRGGRAEARRRTTGVSA